ncbi:hypothetical protein BFW01_g3434 [Lasiodiplodia theobromae]|uniref:Uncharacterized protein n=2 Tax=Lasiodiplodia TaxID=66739 RepID=A0A5N5DRK2_9PEZI|nr:uncharacterized protein LTHEOB_9491 [Lasiodiplodia theobromae]KAB2580608.1 hypothetical protein DBV05_g952 [Lasiodiplodia theobromae]KAF4540017.1 hypothetical protein LTHEOB_9491 [Lasiodiplodia theobromae]KAF9632571.1 hypothetical protein BFW01_g3434 [Lasiodiplodia theobromae]KAK0661398.1 hypothetical protein DIS24_g2658 [Lasiodiplodia hormozganensis]
MVTTEDLKTSIKSLISAIEAQPEFAGQHAARKGKIYFMWDFVTNTLRMLEASANNREAKSDVMQRSMFANILFNDTTGKLTMMTGGDTSEFSADVKAKSEDVQKKAGDWAVAEGILSG